MKMKLQCAERAGEAGNSLAVQTGADEHLSQSNEAHQLPSRTPS